MVPVHFFKKKFLFIESKEIFKLFIPLFLSQFICASSTFIATIMVAKLGENTLAVLALSSIIYGTLCVFAYGVFISIGIVVAKHHSAGRSNLIYHTINQGYLMAFIIGIPFIIVMLFTSKLLFLLNYDQEFIKLVNSYLIALSYSVIPWLILVNMEQFLIGLSLSKVLLIITIIQIPFEILLNYLLIFGKFYFPTCGIAGIGYGLTVTFLVSIPLVYIYMKKSTQTQKYLKQRKKKFLVLPLLLKLLKIGIPIGLINIIESLFFLYFTIMLGQFGIVALAGQQIIKQYLEFSITIGLAMTQSITIRVSYHLGKKLYSSIILSFFTSLSIILIIMFVIAIIYIKFTNIIISVDLDLLLPSNKNLIEYTKTMFIFAAIFQIIDSVRLVIIGIFRGLQDTKLPMYITLLTFCIFAPVITYTLSIYFNLQSPGMWIGTLISLILSIILLIWRLLMIIKSIKI